MKMDVRIMELVENGMDLSCSSGPKAKSRSSCNVNFQQAPLHKPNTSGRVLRRSTSQKDPSRAHDSYSRYSSSITNDDAREVHTNKNGNGKTIKAVYSLEKMKQPEDGEGTGFYQATRKEIQNVVGEIRTELEKVVNGYGSQPKRSNVIEIIADIRNCTTELEQSEIRKQELLAELVAEEQRGKELTKVIRELLSDPKQSTVTERPSQSRRRDNDRKLMSERLDEKVERFLKDFLSNVEDTEGRMEGVSFPWLQWETSTDLSSSPCQNKMRNNLSFDMDDYLQLQQNEDLLFESLRQRHRLESGGLVVCRRSLL